MFLKSISLYAKKTSRPVWILAVFSVIFFFVYAYFPLTSPVRFVSPDETANYFFARQFAKSTTLTVSEPLNEIAGGVIHPRNIGARGAILLPEGFIGVMVLWGSIAKVLGLWVVRLIVPLLAAIAPLTLYAVLRRVFDRRVALIAALALFFVPSYWYYASRSMMNNLPLVVFLILTAWLGLRFYEHRRWSTAVLFGLALGLTLLIRTGEIFWITLITLIAYWLARKRWSIKHLALSALVALICLTPFFIFNTRYFHNPITSALSTNFVETPATQTNISGIAKVGATLFPFGIHFDIAIRNLVNYGIVIFSWWGVFALIGYIREWRELLFALRSAQTTESSPGRRVYLILYTVASVWLVLMYGSWSLREYEDPNRLILGHSFLRYWLPIFVFGLPYFVIGFNRVITVFKRRWIQVGVASLLALGVVSLTAITVLGDPLYGLNKIKSDVKEYQSINTKTVSLTEDNAIIIAGVADKVFYPERRVIVQYEPNSAKYRQNIQLVAHRAPLYCYSIGLDDGCGGLANAQLDNGELFTKLSEVTRFDNGAILFRVDIP